MQSKSKSERLTSQDQSPRFRARAFRCPHCKAFAHQNWFALAVSSVKSPPLQIWKNNVDSLEQNNVLFDYFVLPEQAVKINQYDIGIINSNGAFLKSTLVVRTASGLVVNCYISECASCHQVAIWISEEMRFPFGISDIPEPNPDLPLEIQKDYREAAGIFHVSPRGAAALLRLCIEKLCIFILGERSNINDMIGKLVSMGLDKRIQEALDSVRVIGNEAIHPGELDIRDDNQTIHSLFELVNIISQRLITQENLIKDIYSKIPRNKIARIEARDKISD